MPNVSLPKRNGSPVPKDPNVIVIDCDDVLTWPARNAGGVLISGDIVLKPGATAIAMYATPSTISRSDASDGDPDAEGFMQTFACERPGDDLEYNEFIQKHIGSNLILISTECSDSTGTRMHGTKCNPMKLKYTGTDNKDAKKSALEFTQVQRSKFKMAHYNGIIPTLAPVTPEASEESGI
jgi:hypothetical protein